VKQIVNLKKCVIPLVTQNRFADICNGQKNNLTILLILGSNGNELRLREINELLGLHLLAYLNWLFSLALSLALIYQVSAFFGNVRISVINENNLAVRGIDKLILFFSIDNIYVLRSRSIIGKNYFNNFTLRKNDEIISS
jgi:hypothetical protein